ncbi:MAG: hypothetical protein J6J23_00205 [Clostridia bacterium]|nr:hypothetical protein [Clostridia bacterium]
MKFKTTNITQRTEVLANDHYVAIPYDCSTLTSLATDNIIPAGTIIPSNDANALGVLLNPVDLNNNSNGTIVIHGFIRKDKLPVVPDTTAISALKNIMFLN